MVRLAIGLEDADDLIADLDAALSHRPGRPAPPLRTSGRDTKPVTALRQNLAS
jgi:hypothetical protein